MGTPQKHIDVPIVLAFVVALFAGIGSAATGLLLIGLKHYGRGDTEYHAFMGLTVLGVILAVVSGVVLIAAAVEG